MGKIKNIYKKIFLIVIAFMFSCSDFLEEEPISVLTFDTAYQNQNDLQAGLNGAYNRLFRALGEASGNGFGTGLGSDTNPPRLTVYGDVRAGDVYWGKEGRLFGSIPASPFFDGNIDPVNTYTNWQPFYIVNNIVNGLLELSEEIPFDLPQSKSNFQGEVYFLRALNYFFLLRNWGEVPIISDPYVSGDAEFNVVKADKNAVAEFIANDIATAETLLVNAPFSRIKATSGTLNALKAHFYAWKGRVLGGGDTDLTTAVASAEAVINSANYTLIDSYSSIFYDGYQSNESIFELQATADLNESNLFVWAKEPYRAARSRAMVEFSDDVLTYFENTPIDTRISVLKNDPLPGELVQQPYISKWLGGADPDPALAGPSNENDNLIIFRLADMILLKAECHNELGQLNEAKIELDKVRARAGLETSTAATKEDMAEAIFWERRIELMAEGHLWYDIVRNGKALELEYINSPDEIYLPITLSELDINENLVQNPFYN